MLVDHVPERDMPPEFLETWPGVPILPAEPLEGPWSSADVAALLLAFPEEDTSATAGTLVTPKKKKPHPNGLGDPAYREWFVTHKRLFVRRSQLHVLGSRVTAAEVGVLCASCSCVACI